MPTQPSRPTAAPKPTSRDLWRPDYQHNRAAALLSVWWVIFAGISLYWTLGGQWLVDTAVQADGVRLAQERPAWIVWLLLAVTLVKLLPALFGYLIVTPIGRRIPRRLYLLGGYLGGGAALAYGLLFSLPALQYSVADLSVRGWVRLLLWMPQFWVGGLLLVIATTRFARQTAPQSRLPRSAA